MTEISPHPPPTYRPICRSAINSRLEMTAKSQQAIILVPVPKLQRVAMLFPQHFQIPIKKNTPPTDAPCFTDSTSGENFLGFIIAPSEFICGHKIFDPCLSVCHR
ncbi:hypothetical protein Nepgr_000753 [Nepenthes gracilis]|uniref:Uncharacterized protein n=1 Tax=Nepenthes gracilis TaxID=150966 RepID=A0AAD3P6Z4_NEPGR|nr:hypothetical protein Nepgr_000753 [Nepenthes gracilis]